MSGRRCAIIGGTGMIGGRLAALLRDRGDEVLVLSRTAPPDEHHSRWDPNKGLAEPGRLEGVDVVFNLTGAPIATRPWTGKRRRTLRSSRIDATTRLLESFAGLTVPPKAWIGAGGLGVYGDRGPDQLTEEDPPGEGFLAELSADWERAQLLAHDVLGCRAAVLRMSIVLAADAGAFPLMLFPFRYGMGGWLGDGTQYTPWVSLRDAAAAFAFVADQTDLDGRFNLCAPDPPTNRAWCEALGAAVGRPVATHAPRWALRGALGELADSLFLASVRTSPDRLTDAGFRFEDTDPESTFRRLIAQTTPA